MSAGLPNPINFRVMQHSPTKAGEGVSTRPSARAHMRRYSGISDTPRHASIFAVRLWKLALIEI